MHEPTNIPIDTAAAPPPGNRNRLGWLRVVLLTLGFALLYVFYIDSLATNPPGFYVDESAIAYNAYCIAHTGANEFGTRFPLFFPESLTQRSMPMKALTESADSKSRDLMRRVNAQAE